MKKKIMAVVAAVAALFAVSAGTTAAFAEDYGAATVAGNTVTVSYKAGAFDPYETVNVTVDTDYVSNVVQVANKTYTFKADAQGALNLKLTLTQKALANGGTVTVVAKGATSGKTYSTPAEVPATGAGENTTAGTTSSESAGLAQTGASVAPYAVAAVLLVAAGAAALAVRKQNAR
ncbi:hypothetical protein GFD22_07825 [Bifidobacterium avesanii]|uniref:LPXTG cell wall anchor domain-containing protein n=1 Tax=Bifidobacterium avesanii TaxID=1798157 RepID=A0A7K3TIE8_9BIFI|nr:hypothetical protein [Bifidobacterium avesanii]